MKTGVMRTVLLGISLLAACSSTRQRQTLSPVPITINITNQDRDLDFINLDFYRLRVLDALKNFQSIDLDLAEADEKPVIVLDIAITNFNVWPKEQRIARRYFPRRVVIGKDAKGNPVYGTVTASADFIHEQIRSNASFKTRLRINDTPAKSFEKTFAPFSRLNYTYVDNIRGDNRAIDPALYTASAPPIERDNLDLLLLLSKQEMLDRLSREIRSYYSQKKHPEKQVLKD